MCAACVGTGKTRNGTSDGKAHQPHSEEIQRRYVLRISVDYLSRPAGERHVRPNLCRALSYLLWVNKTDVPDSMRRQTASSCTRRSNSGCGMVSSVAPQSR